MEENLVLETLEPARGMSMEYPIMKSAADAHLEEMKLENEKKGYNAEDFKWFGQSVPNNCFAECLMCEAKTSFDFDMMMRGVPTNCQACKRKALKFYDGDKWDKYFSLKLWEFELFIDNLGTPYCAYVKDDVRHITPIRSDEVRGIVGMRVKNKNQVESALMYMDALARRGGVRYDLNVRVSDMCGEIWIDTASPEWDAIRVSRGGWTHHHQPPIMFKRYSHMKELHVVPGAKKDLDEYVSMMNMASEDDKILYMGYLASLFFPSIDHPILMPLGPQGSAKTTMSIMTRLVVDPSELETRGMPKDADVLPQVLMHHYTPVFDNCGYIDQSVSDVLCQACTGGGFSKRRLYTDDEDVTFTFRRAVVMNGISAPSMSPDLIDRTIIVELDRILEGMRKEKKVIERKRDAILPYVRGYLLDVVSQVMKNGTDEFTALPRMADFARIADACTREMGFKKGRFMEIYMERARQNQKEALSSDPVADALVDYLEANGGYDGSASKLLEELEGKVSINTKKEATWPKTANHLSEFILGKLKPGLMSLGWYPEKVRTKTKRSLKITKCNKDTENSGSLGSFM
jgi:hypothetical protein